MQITNDITVDEISTIVRKFYSKVDKDPLLGPIFAREMKEDWEHHLQKMIDFWTSVILEKSLYKGNPLEVHERIKDLSQQHFEQWLRLFRSTLLEVCVDSKHVDIFYDRAQNMARFMSTIIAKKSKEALC
jgi:hemoglobin